MLKISENPDNWVKNCSKNPGNGVKNMWHSIVSWWYGFLQDIEFFVAS